VGVNSRLDTLQAAIMLPKLEIFEEELQLRQQVANRYAMLLGEARIAAPHVDVHNTSAWAQYTVQVDERDTVQDRLKQAGVPTAVHYPIPLNRQPAVKDEQANLPVGDAVANRVMSLPMHPYLGLADQQFICESLSAATRV
jgi:UDP-2-acetamido-2-deoxy-ribo-hexuluronate aminotransferase